VYFVDMKTMTFSLDDLFRLWAGVQMWVAALCGVRSCSPIRLGCVGLLCAESKMSSRAPFTPQPQYSPLRAQTSLRRLVRRVGMGPSHPEVSLKSIDPFVSLGWTAIWKESATILLR
jgi:hypothetical protein